METVKKSVYINDKDIIDRMVERIKRLLSPEEVEKYKKTIGTVIYPAMREGKILYEKAS